MAFSEPGPCCMQKAPMVCPELTREDSIRRIQPDPLLPH